MLQFSTRISLIIGAAAASVVVNASEHIVVLPQHVSLSSSHSAQQLIVERMSTNRYVGDITSRARFSSSNPTLCQVDGRGHVTPLRDGDATIVVKAIGLTTHVPVHISGLKSGSGWSFRNDVIPVLTRQGCNGGSCHGAAAGKGGLRLSLRGFDPESDYDALCRQANDRRVIPGRPQDSLLLLKPTMTVGHAGGLKLVIGSPEYRAVQGWIEGGAPAPRKQDLRVESIELSPDVASLHPGDVQQISVTARYSDGASRDVTRLVKFGSVDGSVASVNDSGLIKVTGRGETAITAWYASKVNYARIVSPYPDSGAAMSWRQSSPDTSLIDRLIRDKLKELNVPESPIAGDGEFIRRVFLDTAGILPTPQETNSFLEDRSPGKRDRLIKSLLTRPEYVDYWTYKWSDLLLLNSKAIPAETLNSFYGYIHASVEQNKPWNTFVREIVTASGSTLENGAAAFFVIHKDPFDLTETTTQAFMGMSLMCAHCHNHPLERWTQRDYYQMANLYARVRLKNGDKAGEVFVLTSNVGDIPHPKLGTALAPRPLESAEMRMDDPTDRRERLADWLTGPTNRLFPRSIVNRVWRNFFGRGLVEAEDDLRATNPPCNAPLMEALTTSFVASGYDVKELIQSILMSEAYQRSADPVGVNRFDERQFSHYYPRRLPAEPLLDAISKVTGVASEFKDLPKATRATQLKDSQVASYFLTAFGRPVREKTCACERQRDPNVAQALHLSNGDTINERLKKPGGLIDALIKADVTDSDAMNRIYLSALCRLPSESERHSTLKLMSEYSATAPATMAGRSTARRAALEDLCWAVLTSREFVFNH